MMEVVVLFAHDMRIGAEIFLKYIFMFEKNIFENIYMEVHTKILHKKFKFLELYSVYPHIRYIF